MFCGTVQQLQTARCPGNFHIRYYMPGAFMYWLTQMNGTVTLVENIADSGGIHIAFQAYRDVNINQSLPNIDLSNDEIFFVSFGQVSKSTHH